MSSQDRQPPHLATPMEKLEKTFRAFALDSWSKSSSCVGLPSDAARHRKKMSMRSASSSTSEMLSLQSSRNGRRSWAPKDTWKYSGAFRMRLGLRCQTVH
eukprot:2240800-Amphidinium_carterae.1